MCTRKTGNRIKQDHHIMSAFYQSFCFLQSDGRNLYVFFSRFIKSRSNYFCLYTSFHIGNLFRTFIDQYDHQVTFRMICGNGICNFFQQHRFTGFWLCNDQSTLSFTDRRKQVHDPGTVTIRSCKQIQLFEREKRCEIIERNTVAYIFRTFAIDGFDFQQSKIFFTFFWRTNCSINSITCF